MSALDIKVGSCSAQGKPSNNEDAFVAGIRMLTADQISTRSKNDNARIHHSSILIIVDLLLFIIIIITVDPNRRESGRREMNDNIVIELSLRIRRNGKKNVAFVETGQESEHATQWRFFAEFRG